MARKTKLQLSSLKKKQIFIPNLEMNEDCLEQDVYKETWPLPAVSNI